MNKTDIINDLEKELGIECDPNEDFDILCDGDTCRHSECQCWDDLKSDVRNHLEKKEQKARLCGSITVGDLRELLMNTPDDDAPVFINNEPIYECWNGSDGKDRPAFRITTRQLAEVV